MDAWQLELARQAVALLRESLMGEESPRIVKIIVESVSVSDRAVAGLAVHLLLGRCIDPADLERVLDHLDRFFSDRLADRLIEGIDWDVLLDSY